ncbi:hypothetical protein [Alicyclobacillus sp. SO9]|uniref:hypothetical protein n=1 Tax=Alicyclobacillus sp. SO9 TaxID=2665646 RepID=UPI0018E7F209|nr:hypothetical protein [Alicyclobacillus sp. SO9]QQE80917.1 hypothetical protein GI364_11330 [Alicyclobacillus sp. SO9]
MSEFNEQFRDFLCKTIAEAFQKPPRWRRAFVHRRPVAFWRLMRKWKLPERWCGRWTVYGEGPLHPNCRHLMAPVDTPFRDRIMGIKRDNAKEADS